MVFNPYSEKSMGQREANRHETDPNSAAEVGR